MGRFEGILLCSDLDGTIASGREVPERNLQALRYFQSEGGRFSLFTGRPAGYEANFPFFINSPMVTENGARIYDPQTRRTLWTFPLDGSGFLLEWLDGSPLLKGKITCSLCFTDATLMVTAGELADTFLKHATGDLLKTVCRDFSTEEEALTFLDLARKTFQTRYNIHRSWATGVEFISPLGGKGACLNHLRTILGDSVRTVVAVGDYENDDSMLLAADRAFAPANALPRIRAVAEKVLCDCREGAVGELIEILDREYEGGILK